jgi:hypothetical protein
MDGLDEEIARYPDSFDRFTVLSSAGLQIDIALNEGTDPSIM